MNEWITVEDRSPLSPGRYLVYAIPTCNSCEKIWAVREARYGTAKHYEEIPPFEWMVGEYECPIKLTHWMPLPEKPKREINE